MAAVDSGSNETLVLNIMPMLDIFSILILFLLMSFSTDPVNHSITQGLDIPESVTLRSLDEIPIITVTKTELRFNEKKVASVDPATGDFTQEDKRGGQGALLGLYDELEKMSEKNKERRRQKLSEVEDPDSISPDALTMEIDKKHDFVVLRRVMKSAQQAEFISFKLMVLKEPE
ncbi:MAG: biopolymer transporter ExbD [Proteobacteria bacterium]|nr:biopolymer transporter ExbD [Pseudomonadota bacterium]